AVPIVIVARTLKGKGVSFMEGKAAWHGKPIGDEDFIKAVKELGGEA
ncbi:MAG TPA: transketolase, partial [Clostridia bacterium]|nr:transketolase [Clostridia bacterium]